MSSNRVQRVHCVSQKNLDDNIDELAKFSITPGCIRKIPLNPPLQKGEEVGMPGLIEKLCAQQLNETKSHHIDYGVQ